MLGTKVFTETLADFSQGRVEHEREEGRGLSRETKWMCVQQGLDPSTVPVQTFKKYSEQRVTPLSPGGNLRLCWLSLMSLA